MTDEEIKGYFDTTYEERTAEAIAERRKKGANGDIYGLMAHNLGEVIDPLNLMEYWGKKIAIFSGNQMLIGTLGDTRVATGSARTNAIKNVVVVRRNRRVTKHRTKPLWVVSEEDYGSSDMMFLYTGPIIEVSERSRHVTSDCPGLKGTRQKVFARLASSKIIEST